MRGKVIFAGVLAGMLLLALGGGFATGKLTYAQGALDFNVVSGPTCANPIISIQDPNGGGLIAVHPLAISYTYTVYHIHGSPDGAHFYTTETWSTCYKLVVNGGLDQLSILDGNNKTGGPVYMVVSTNAAAPGAADTVCGAGTGAYIINGFSVANALSSYAHSVGTSTYTLTFTWTSTAGTTTVIATAWHKSHSSATAGSAAATALVDESNLSPTATMNNNGDKLQLTATVTV